MNGRRPTALAALLLACAACGSGSNGHSSSAPKTTSLTVEAVAATLGYGCTYDTWLSAGDQLVVKDAQGRTLGIATFANAKPRGCHWLTTVDLPDRTGFYDLVSDGNDLGTVHRTSTGPAWKVNVNIDYPLKATLTIA